MSGNSSVCLAACVHPSSVRSFKLAAFVGDDTMTGDGGEYLRPEDLKELGDDSLPSSQFLDGMNYLRYSLEGGRSDSLRSFSSDRSHTLSHASYLRDSAMIDDTVVIPSQQVTRSHRTLQKSPISSGFLVSFMVDARGGAMRGCRHNGLRIIIPPRKCTAPTRVTCRLVKRHRLATMPPMVEGEGLASRLIEVGPSGAQFLGPVIVEIPHFAALRGKERELVILRSENGDSWKEHFCEYTEDELNEILNGMDEVLDTPEELEKKRICRIITRDFPQYFAVVSRIKQDSNLIGPEGGVLSSTVVPQVQAVFPEGALTKRIRVGLQAQPMHTELIKKILGNKATFSPIVTLEPRRRKFHKPITMTIPVPKASSDGIMNGYGGDTPTLRLLCSITGRLKILRPSVFDVVLGEKTQNILFLHTWTFSTLFLRNNLKCYKQFKPETNSNTTQEPCGRLSFMKEPKSTRGLVHQAICNLNITLPVYTKYQSSEEDDRERTEERLAHIADHLGFSWTELARELDFTEEQIHQIRIENPNSLQDQSHALLKYWLERDGKHATDTSLTQCLTKINRMDIVHLMETSGIDSMQVHGTRTYAEIEQTIGLDHSEGFSVLQEELYSSRHKPEEHHRISKDSDPPEHPPIVSEEDVSVSYSPFQDSTPRSEAELSMAELLRQTHKEQVEAEFSGKPQDVVETTSSQHEYFVTTPGTEQTAASDPSARFSATKEEREETSPQPPSSAQRGGSPIIQEPEELHLHQDDLSPRRTSLVIVESTDEQPEKLGSGYEEESLEKADSMPEMPPETVTEEQYTDEHGHTVVKKVLSVTLLQTDVQPVAEQWSPCRTDIPHSLLPCAKPQHQGCCE
uniref:Ankyrin 2 n=1 Tax=Pavo cristatus TaxID=9049 RepID=A0A8C9EQ27_PAVCR